MYGLNYDGLRKKETYDEIVDYLENKQEKIKYPDRTAKQLRNSPQLSNLLDGDNEAYNEIDKQQTAKIMYEVAQNLIRKESVKNNESERISKIKENKKPENYNINIKYDDIEDIDVADELDDEIKYQEEIKKEKMRKTVETVLSDNKRTTEELMGEFLSSTIENLVNPKKTEEFVLTDNMDIPDKTEIIEEYDDSTQKTITEPHLEPSFAGSSKDVQIFDNNKNKSYWKKQKKDYILKQLKMRGVEIETSQLKGKNKFTKDDLVETIIEKIGI